jgi:hypothetical protein
VKCHLANRSGNKISESRGKKQCSTKSYRLYGSSPVTSWWRQEGEALNSAQDPSCKIVIRVRSSTLVACTPLQRIRRDLQTRSIDKDDWPSSAPYDFPQPLPHDESSNDEKLLLLRSPILMTYYLHLDIAISLLWPRNVEIKEIILYLHCYRWGLNARVARIKSVF